MPPAESYFLGYILAYTDRVLSYDNDRLNAFRGILSRAKLASHLGVPVFNTDSTMALVIASAESAQLTTFQRGFLLVLCWVADSKALMVSHHLVLVRSFYVLWLAEICRLLQ